MMLTFLILPFKKLFFFYAGGKIGLIDYGQSKRLPDSCRAAFAMLVLAMVRGDEEVSNHGEVIMTR